MHQHPRPVARAVAAAASNVPPGSSRTSSPREDQGAHSAVSPSMSSESSSTRSGISERPSQQQQQAQAQEPNPERQRLNLIVQHFFTKSALMIISSRVYLPPMTSREGVPRLDKWFNTWIEDSNVISAGLTEWRNCQASTALPPPMVIEMYFDLSNHPQGQGLTITDSQDKRWDVSRGLAQFARNQGFLQAPNEIVFERWTVSLNDALDSPAAQLNDAPPNTYKKAIVLLRSLYTFARFLPAWKLSRKLVRQAGNGTLPKPKFRILRGAQRVEHDTLSCPLTSDAGPVTEVFEFERLLCSFGAFKIGVQYRSNSDFGLDAAERLLSAQITTGSTSVESPGRVVDSTSDELGLSSKYKPWVRMPSGERDDGRLSAGSKSSLRSETVATSLPRRTSISFQPFKAGSLSSSPATAGHLASSPGGSLGRPVGAVPAYHSRSRSSLNTLPQQALRNPGLVNENAVSSSTSSSPKPAPIQRYSSSFSNRRVRLPSSAGTPKPEDDGLSSRGSVSSAQRAPYLAPDQDPMQDDSESIGDFLKMLDVSSRSVSSFARTDATSLAANSQRTTAQYTRFAKMKDTTAQLSDSMSSSLMHRTSASSLRQLPSTSGLSGAQIASPSNSSSPGGKPMSPHTPHMPIVPSRLSNNSIASYSQNTDSTSRTVRPEPSHSSSLRETSRLTPSRDNAARGIDIPSLPRTTSERRSSSFAITRRPGPRLIATGAIDDDLMPYGMRSASLPADDATISSRLSAQTSSTSRADVRRSSAAGPRVQDEDEDEEEEPLLFDLGELERESQRRA